MKRGITALAALTLLLGGIVPARASIVLISSAAGLSPTDTTTGPYPGADGSSFASGSTLSAGGNTLTFTNANAQDFLRTDQDVSWYGAYPTGTQLIQNLLPGTVPPNNPGGTPGGTVTVAFASPVAEFGVSVQQDNAGSGSTTFTLTAYTAGGPTPFVLSAVLNSNNVLTFLGAKDSTGAASITRFTISSTDSGNSSYNNDFVLGPVTFGGAPEVGSVPEPATLVSCVLGVVALLAGGLPRRRAAA